MHDRYPRPEYEARIFEYFLDAPGREAERAEYERRGIVPTGNFCQYFWQNTPKQFGGMPNPLHYTNRPFGPIIEEFSRDEQELWTEAVTLEAARVADSIKFTEKFRLADEDEREQLRVRASSPAQIEREWEHHTLFSKIFLMVAPKMDAAGIDPLTACT